MGVCTEVRQMDVISVKAIYQNGVIKPLTPLTLPENEPVTLQIFRQTEETIPSDLPPGDFAALRGIWIGLGDPTYEAIETITRQAAQERVASPNMTADKG